MSAFGDKIKSISFPQRSGQSETRVARTSEGAVIETEHWDGRQDAVARPAPVRMRAQVHRTGRKRGKVAEVRRMTSKERREKYGTE